VSDDNPLASPDLAWMLQSGQASDTELVHALVWAYYPAILASTQSILSDPGRAEPAAREALANAVIKAHEYRYDRNLQDWLLGITAQTCQRSAFQRPSDLSRADESRENSAENLELIAKDIEKQVAQMRHRKKIATTIQEIALAIAAILMVILFGNAVTPWTSEPTPTSTIVKIELVTQLVLITSTPAPTATPTPYPERALFYTAAKGDTLESIAFKIGLPLEILQTLNGMAPDVPLKAGQQVMIGIGGPPLSQITPTPVTPAPLLEPLTLQSSPEEILRRIQENKENWHTLWADAQVIRYGPPGYVGPPRVKREQIWISQPSYGLSVSGALSGDLDFVSLSKGGEVKSLDLTTGQHNFYGGGGLVDYSLAVAQLLEPGSLRTFLVDDLAIVGSEQVIGRESLVVDWPQVESYSIDTGDPLRQRQYLDRYWVDSVTGVILRKRQLGGEHLDLIIEEISVTEIAFDVDIPNRIFDEYRPFPTRFAQDHRGEPLSQEAAAPTHAWAPLPGREPLPSRPPPSEFDPFSARLVFQWTSLPDPETSSTQAEVFADGYSLGSVEFANPFSVVCDRSPNGQMIAFFDWKEIVPYGANELRWFSLNDLSVVIEPLPEVLPSDFAFSPDSQRLAVFGCNAQNENCGLYILDLATQAERKLLPLAAVSALTWSPDSTSLAFLGGLETGLDWQVWVIDAQTGEIIYQGVMDWDANRAASDSPTQGWGIPFPVYRGGLEACSAPPPP